MDSVSGLTGGAISTAGRMVRENGVRWMERLASGVDLVG